MRSEALKRAQIKYMKSAKGRKLWRDNMRQVNAKQAAKKRGATIGDLTEIATIYKRAKWWRQWFDVLVDHVVPFGRGGTHEASNLQIIYASENRRKGVKLDYKPRVIFL